ncbi:MAG: hypothetical protein PHC61_12410, partial [Chitinivibrionales bacterium]|nr:hypothetical protein [Chitinivibrionales bacterium]
RSLYLCAWINNDLLKKNRTAMRLYDSLCARYPTSDLCTRCAQPRLKTARDTLAAHGLLKKFTANDQSAKSDGKPSEAAKVGAAPSPASPVIADTSKKAPPKNAVDSLSRPAVKPALIKQDSTKAVPPKSDSLKAFPPHKTPAGALGVFSDSVPKPAAPRPASIDSSKPALKPAPAKTPVDSLTPPKKVSADTTMPARDTNATHR